MGYYVTLTQISTKMFITSTYEFNKKQDHDIYHFYFCTINIIFRKSTNKDCCIIL